MGVVYLADKTECMTLRVHIRKHSSAVYVGMVMVVCIP